MDKEMALEESIKHWEKNARAESLNDIDLSDSACALCSLFHKKGCYGCPVSAHTKQPYCRGTPYGEAAIAKSDWLRTTRQGLEVDEKKKNFHVAAQKEVEFLKSLRKDT